MPMHWHLLAKAQLNRISLIMSLNIMSHTISVSRDDGGYEQLWHCLGLLCSYVSAVLLSCCCMLSVVRQPTVRHWKPSRTHFTICLVNLHWCCPAKDVSLPTHVCTFASIFACEDVVELRVSWTFLKGAGFVSSAGIARQPWQHHTYT